MKMQATVPRRPDGSPDFDEWAFRRQLAKEFQADVSDVLLKIEIVVLVRNFRTLAAVHQAANNLFNISITVFYSTRTRDLNSLRHPFA